MDESMAKRWSKLQKRLYNLMDTGIREDHYEREITFYYRNEDS